MDTILATGRLRAEQFNREGAGFKNTDRKNAYECEACGSYIVTIDRDPGVTPFMVKCGNCGGMAQSKMYRVQDCLVPTHEWYRPVSLFGIDKRSYDHLEKGGLLLRAIDGNCWQRPDFRKQKYNIAEEVAALKRQFDDVEKERRAKVGEELMSRQQRRQASRKNSEPPEEITMYGVRYRRVGP